MPEEVSQPDPLDRPLPSVGIPLLREERRATRVRQAVVGAVVVVGLAGSVTAAATLLPGGGDGDEPEPEDRTWTYAVAPAVAEPEPSSPAEAPPRPPSRATSMDERPQTPRAGEAPSPAPPAQAPVKASVTERGRRVTRPFGDARGFRNALQQAGLDRDECQALETALDGVLDFRRCRPEDRMVFERTRDGTLELFEYYDSSTELVRARRGAGGDWSAVREQRPVTRHRIERGGRVDSALGEALASAGLRRSIVGVFLEVFEGAIDFSTDTRAGDTFRIIVDEELIEGRFIGYGNVHAVEYAGSRAGTKRAFWFEPRGGEPDYYDETGRAIHGGWLRPPCRYDRISSRFDPRRLHPILRRVVPHNGVDYAASTGTPVWAAASGVVTWAGERGANGNLVSIRHDGGYESFYAHLSRIARGIERDVRVDQRQIIGAVGSTGRSTGPHLHFGLKREGRFVDPLAELDGPGRMMPAGVLPHFRRQARALTTRLAAIPVAGGAPPAPVEHEAPEEPAVVDGPMD